MDASIGYAARQKTGNFKNQAISTIVGAEIHTFTKGMTRDAGYLAIVAATFGDWRIWHIIGVCLKFGATTALQFQFPALGIH